MVLAVGEKNARAEAGVLMPVFELISRNDLDAEDIVVDHDVKNSKWSHTQRTLRNFVSAMNLLHPKRPDVVVKVMDVAFTGLLAFFEQAVSGKRISEDERMRIARSAFLMPNIIEGLAALGEETVSRFVREYETAFDLYEGEWLDGVRDYANPKKTQVYSGVPFRDVDPETGDSFVRPITVAITTSKSERIGSVCRRGNWSKDRGASREDMTIPARRSADVVLHFQEGNHRKFTISTKHIDLSDVAAAIRAADALAKGVRRLTPEQVSDKLGCPGHVTVRTPDGTPVEMLYLAEFRKAFGHLRSNPFSEPTALSKRMIKGVLRRALTEGLTRRLANDILEGTVLTD